MGHSKTESVPRAAAGAPSLIAAPRTRVLLVDNYDSFTYNLAQLVAEVTGDWPTVVRNDISQTGLNLDDFTHAILSPGPGSPNVDTDVGISKYILLNTKVPILGVCLGHQLLATIAGGVVSRAPRAVHGRISLVTHTGDPLFDGVPNPFEAVRYHSLAVSSVPEKLQVTAVADDGVVMALRDPERPVWGIQFHPESILSQGGTQIISNFLSEAAILNDPSLNGPADERRNSRASQRKLVDESSAGDRERDKGVRQPRQDGGNAATSSGTIKTRVIETRSDPATIYEALYGDDSQSVWLDSNSSDARSEISVMGTLDGELSHVLTYTAGSGVTIRLDSSGATAEMPGDILSVAQRQLGSFNMSSDPSLPFDFHLGYIGYLGYGLKADTSDVPDPVPSELPDARLLFLQRAVVFDHRDSRLYLMELIPSQYPDAGENLDAGHQSEDQRHEKCDWIAQTEAIIAGIEGRLEPQHSEAAHGSDQAADGEAPREVPDLPDDSALESSFKFRHSRSTYLDKISQIQERILDGQTYQVCLTNMVEYPHRVCAYDVYSILRSIARVPYGALIRCGDFSLLSASPECFLTVGGDGTLETRPIKGTRERGQTGESDRRLKRELLDSEKERAENLMIVDLMRNDLNAVSEARSVHVPSLFSVESFPSVHQLISTVRGKLRAGLGATDAIRAAFPAGSMTGTPKIRTMQIIDELEEGPRGIYSGSIGWLSLNGSVSLSVVIRSVVVEPHRATFGIGGAITQLSDPGEEYRETLTKARVVAAALLTGDLVAKK